MRRPKAALGAPVLVLVLLPACDRSSSGRAAPSPSAIAPVNVPPPPSAPAEVIESEPLPDSWKRYYLDQNRFSAQLPAKPKVKEVVTVVGTTAVTYEVHDPAGSLFVVACTAPPADRTWLSHMHEIAASTGHILSEGRPDFFGTPAYEMQVLLPNKSERVQKLIEYRGRYCTVAGELGTDADEVQARRFIASFRPEPAPR
jgi:hypothetical protein